MITAEKHNSKGNIPAETSVSAKDLWQKWTGIGAKELVNRECQAVESKWRSKRAALGSERGYTAF